MSDEQGTGQQPSPTELPPTAHLIERAARRLQRDGNAGATGLLNAGAPLQPLTPLSPRPAASPGDPTPLAQPRAATNGQTATQATGLGALPNTPSPATQASTIPKAAVIEKATLERAGMIDWTKHRQRMSEEFRIIQGQLVQAIAAGVPKGKSLPNILMITSARPGEGKTFTALNLAGSLARYGNRPVILVDMDSSRHTLSSRLGLDREPGLLDLAVDARLPIESLLIPTCMASLSFLPVGGLNDVRAILSASTPIIDLIERLAHRFPGSTIILDAPPCLSSSDPSTLAHLVGQAVMLVEAQRTQRTEVEAALDLIDACPSVSLILTKVKLTASDTFGAYGYY